MNRSPHVKSLLAAVLLLLAIVLIFRQLASREEEPYWGAFRAKGWVAGQELAQRLPGGGRLLVLAGDVEGPVGRNKLEGIKSALKEHDGFDSVEVKTYPLDSGFDPERATDWLVDWLNESPGPDAVVILTPLPTLGASDVKRLPRPLPFMAVLDGSLGEVEALVEAGAQGFFIEMVTPPPANPEYAPRRSEALGTTFDRYYRLVSFDAD